MAATSHSLERTSREGDYLDTGNYLIRRLGSLADLSDDDMRALLAISGKRGRHPSPRERIIEEGDKPSGGIAILEGWACKYKITEEGRRRIIGFLLPGDCDLQMSLLHEMDYSIEAITRVVAVEISRPLFEKLVCSSASLGRALTCDSLMNSAIQREWTVNVGRHSAFGRVANLLCELFLRLQRVGLVTDDRLTLPLSQNDLADALSLTNVCVNRMLQQMRFRKLIELKDHVLAVPSLDALAREAGFNANYLHLTAWGEDHAGVGSGYR